jgi:hypothetical protein
MSDIINNQSDFLSFIADEAMNGGNLSIRGVARCCGVADTSIIRDAAFKSEKLAEHLTPHGFEPAALVENGFNPQAVWLTIEYFAYESKAKAPMAKQLARTFGAIGVMTTLEQLKPKQPEPTALPPHHEAREVAETIVYIHEYLAKTDVRLAQILIDRAMQTVQSVPLLPGSNAPMAGVVEIAKTLGFNVGKEQSMLGTAVAKAWRAAGKGEPIDCKREVGGAMRPVKVYPIGDPTVVEAIRSYYQRRAS